MVTAGGLAALIGTYIIVGFSLGTGFYISKKMTDQLEVLVFERTQRYKELMAKLQAQTSEPHQALSACH